MWPPELTRADTGPAAASLVEPIPFALLDAPLDYLFADHWRQRRLCAALRRFGEAGRVRRAEADAAIAFLDRDLALHHRDQDEDLVPVLRRRALPEDDLGTVLARLAEDHRQSLPMIESIVDALAAHPADDPVRLRPRARETLLAFAAAEQRHLALENGIVLAIARIRLTRADLRAIGQAMKRRRGVAA